jgi:DNA polymerase I
MGKYMVFDLETETHSSYKRKANPFDERNWVVMRGWKVQGQPRGSYEYFPEHNRTSYLKIPEDVDLLVGLNIKFDLLYEMAQNNPDLRAFFKRGGKIWCCQYAEYLLYGAEQSVHMVSMDQIIEKYGGRLKIDEVKLLWEAGVKTSEIDEELLLDYLLGTSEEGRNSGDIGNTELIFLGQIRKALQQCQIKMIQDRMDGLLCTTEMEFNGLKIDVVEAGKRLKDLTEDLQKQTLLLNQYIPKDLPWEFNWNSRIQTSSLIFGGTVKYQVREEYMDESTGELARYNATERWPKFDGVAEDPKGMKSLEHELYGTLFYKEGLLGKQVQDRNKSGKFKGQGKYKNVTVPGELKIKWQDRFYKMPGYTKGKKEWESKEETDAAGVKIYSTSGDTLDEVLAETQLPFLWALNRKNTLDKEIGTYYVKFDADGKSSGMLTCVQKHDSHHPP